MAFYIWGNKATFKGILGAYITIDLSLFYKLSSCIKKRCNFPIEKII